MIRARRNLPRGGIARKIVTLVSGTAVAQIVTIISLPIVTRLYSPELIGVVSLFLAFFNFWLTLLTWRYEGALLIAKNDSESHRVFTICIFFTVVMSLIAMPVLYFLCDLKILGFESLPWWASIAAVPTLLGYGLFMTFRSWALRAGLVRQISRATIARSVTNAITKIVFGFAGLGIYGLFAAEVLGSWAAIGALRSKASVYFAMSSTEKIEWSNLKKAFFRFKKFPQYELPSVAINQLAIALPIPIVSALYGTQAAGWFGMARLIVAIPNGQIGKAVADVFQMELSKYIRQNQFYKARKLFYSLLIKLGVIGLVPMTGVILFGPRLAPWILGENWRELGLIAAYIAPWFYAALVVSTLSRLLSVLETQQFKLIYDITVLVIVLLSYFYAKWGQIELLEFIIVLTIGSLAAYLIYLFVIIYVVNTRLRND